MGFNGVKFHPAYRGEIEITPLVTIVGDHLVGGNVAILDPRKKARSAGSSQ